MQRSEIEWMPIASIKPYDKNPRRNDDAVDAVANSITEFGFKNPIIVGSDLTIIAGHTRWKAARKLGLKEVPVIIASDLTPEQVKAFRIIDNKTAELADWDLDLLKGEMDDLDINWSEFGFDDDVGDECIDMDDAFGEEFSLPDGDRADIEHMSFVVTHQQAEIVREAINCVEGGGTDEGGNPNGFRISEVCRQWLAQRT